jgi:hypothetical protein
MENHHFLMGKLVNYGTSPFLIEKSTISMVIFNSKLLNYQGVVGNGWLAGGCWTGSFPIQFPA